MSPAGWIHRPASAVSCHGTRRRLVLRIAPALAASATLKTNRLRVRPGTGSAASSGLRRRRPLEAAGPVSQPLTDFECHAQPRKPQTHRALNHAIRKSDFASLSECFRLRIPRRGVIKTPEPRNGVQIDQILERLRYPPLIAKMNPDEATSWRQKPRFPTYTSGHTPPLTRIVRVPLYYHSTTTPPPLGHHHAKMLRGARLTCEQKQVGTPMPELAGIAHPHRG